MAKKKLYIIPSQHMDLVWRRCFDRDISYKGKNFVSYADIEAIYIGENLRLCRQYPQFRFMIESVAVLEKYLQRHPEDQELIDRYIREQRIFVSFTGHNIVDSNLITGESLIRNYQYGYHYLHDRYGLEPEVGDRCDAFGNSAQLPQILRGFGVRWLQNIHYTDCTAPYWQGLDGSTIFAAYLPRAGSIGGFPKFPPCPACGGHRDKPCEVCGGKRVDFAHMDRRRFHLKLDEKLVAESEKPCYIIVGGEEVHPNEDPIRWAEANGDRFDIEFTGYDTYAKHYAEEIALADNPPAELVQESRELNCNNTGVYVSRIKIKQKLRRLEYTIFAAETEALRRWQLGEAYPWETFRQIWDKALFAMFHDAVTGTHVDAGYEEIMDAMDEAMAMAEALLPRSSVGASQLQVCNPAGLTLSGICEAEVPAGMLVDAPILSAETKDGRTQVRFHAAEVPAFGSKTVNLVADDGRAGGTILYEAAEEEGTGDAVLNNVSVTAEAAGGFRGCTMENEFYRIVVSEHGIESVFDKKQQKIAAQAGTCKVGEWILEVDIGSPWGTESVDMRRIPLGRHITVLRHEKTADRETVTFRVLPDIRYGFSESSFDLDYQVTLLRGADRIFFSADVRWDARDHRLRVAFPAAFAGKHLYDIPYGMLERRPYENNIVLPSGDSDWAAASGDAPGVHWAGIDGGDRSIALFNQGTPSYLIEADPGGGDTIFLTVLRSPTLPNCLGSGRDYEMTEYHGMSDSGRHHFDFSLASYGSSFADSTVHADGLGSHVRLQARAEQQDLRLPRILSDHTWISSVQPTRAGDGIDFRAAEFRGKGGTLQFRVPDGVKTVTETDLRGKPLAVLNPENGIVTTQIRPFQIQTYRLTVCAIDS